MKYNGRYIIVLPLVLIIMLGEVSCKKNFFNLAPTSELSPASFWKTENDATQGLTGVYSALWNVELEELPYLDVLTPNGYSNYPWEGWQSGAYGLWTSTNGGSPDGQGDGNLWNGVWLGIGRANTFLANIGSVDMDASLKKRMIGEVRFIRAYYYFYAINFWGAVHLILDTLTVS